MKKSRSRNGKRSRAKAYAESEQKNVCPSVMSREKKTELRKNASTFKDAPEIPGALAPVVVATSVRPSTRARLFSVGSVGSNEVVSLKMACGLVKAVRSIHQKGNKVISTSTIITAHITTLTAVMRSPARFPALSRTVRLPITVAIPHLRRALVQL